MLGAAAVAVHNLLILAALGVSNVVAAAASSGSPSITNILLILVGSGGAIGMVTAFMRVPSDRSNAAITQAQGAMETMAALNQQLKDALAEARRETTHQRDRAEFYKRQLEQLHSSGRTSVIDAALRRGGMILHPDDEGTGGEV